MSQQLFTEPKHHQNTTEEEDYRYLHEEYYKTPKICNGIIDAIGNTPGVRLQNLPKSEGIKCEMLMKCEFLNPGGSSKDRIARKMILNAEKQRTGAPNQNYTIIEPTSGNTGIGLAVVSAVKKYDLIITGPDTISQEKSDTLNALGAKIIRTPAEADFFGEHSHNGVAKTLSESIDKSIVLNQYTNPSNPMSHYDQTAEEIWEQCDGKLDCVVISGGTGGMITGLSRKLKQKDPQIKIVGVDPFGSIVALPEHLNETDVKGYKIEGIGHKFVPQNLHRECVDEWIKTDDYSSFRMARKVIEEEGGLIGGSSGATMYAAVQVAKKMNEGERVVVICVDGIRNYMTKFLNDDWMYENGFYNEEEYVAKYYSKEAGAQMQTNGTIKDLNLPITEGIEYKNVNIKDILNSFKERKVNQLLALDENGELVGVILKSTVVGLLSSGKISGNDLGIKVIKKDFRKSYGDDPLFYLSRAFLRYDFVVIGDKNDPKTLRMCTNDDYLSGYLSINHIEI